MKTIIAKTLSILLITASTLTPTAHAADIISGDHKSGIQVISSPDGKFVSFKFCTDMKTPSSCEALGSAKWYSQEQLESEKAWDYARASGHAVLTVYFGFLAGVSTVCAAWSAGATLIGTAALVPVSVYFGKKTLNRVAEANMLSPEFLNDKLIVSENDGTTFFNEEVQTLKNILEIIDEENSKN